MNKLDCMWVVQYRMGSKWRYCYHVVGLTKKDATRTMNKLRGMFGMEYEYRLRKYVSE